MIFLLFLLRALGGSASASLPGPPTFASLEVVGSNALRTKWSAPLLDGGDPVTSYLVEWDKEAGIPETQAGNTCVCILLPPQSSHPNSPAQRIEITQNLNTNEIQSIRTSAPDINEIQAITTTATPQPEVQAITVSPILGDVTVDGSYSFAVSLDTISSGGSLQYSGQISAGAAADGTRTSVAHILENMANLADRPVVERSTINPDGGHTYFVTFPVSMGDVPEMEVFMTDLPVSIATVQEGNELLGSFRLEFGDELTADIPFDASSAILQSRLEELESVGAVSVSRSLADDQGGFTWHVEFLVGEGNLPSIVAHGDGLRTSNNAAGGAALSVITERDGSYIAGEFTLSFRGVETNPISSDAAASELKDELESLPSIARVDVVRSPLDAVGGCTFQVSFLEDGQRIHRGDMPMFEVKSYLTGTPGETNPSISVEETRKGTEREVQMIRVDAGSDPGVVDPTSTFRIAFGGAVTGDIPALPLGGSTCLGSKKAKQIITTSTADTSGVGGDDSVSHLTTFALLYEGHATGSLIANGVSCEDTAHDIQAELMKLPPLYEVDVSGERSDAGDEGCVWVVTFLSVMGNPEIMKVQAWNSGEYAGPAQAVTVGDEYSIIRDTVAITQPENFKGDDNLIQAELSKLPIGEVTVSPANATPDSSGQCAWLVTFETKAGDVPPLEVSGSGGSSSDFSTIADLHAGNTVTVIDDEVRGTSFPVSGDFRLEYDGQLTGYLPHDASAELLRSAIHALPNTGHVDVVRIGPDVNDAFAWDVTFVDDLGPLPLLRTDDLDLQGTVVSMSVTKKIKGALPPFDPGQSEDYGSMSVSDDGAEMSALISGLKQGIPYYVRISALNAHGMSPAVMPYRPVHVPSPLQPAPPDKVEIVSEDSTTLSVSIQAPFHDGGEPVTSMRVETSTVPFAQERQRISLTCSPEPEIQLISTSAADIAEIQYLVLDSSYSGNGVMEEIQRVECDATGGTFGLQFGGETAYIAHDADAVDIKDSLESLSSIDTVEITLNGGTVSACQPFQGSSSGDFSVTFTSTFGFTGDLPLMTTERTGLEGARLVTVSTVVDGDAPLGGSLRLSFRGAVSESIDVSSDAQDLVVAIDSSLEALDTIQQDGIVVSSVSLPGGGHEKIFKVEFIGSGLGGDVESLVVAPTTQILGSSAAAFVLSDGESYTARNEVDTVTSQVGNELSGSFRLRLRGHTTGAIPFNSSIDLMKERLEELANIGRVRVERTGPSQESEYNWAVTFESNPGYFPPSTRDVDLLEGISSLETSVPTDNSGAISISSTREGDDRLFGTFELSYNDGSAVATTRPLESFISAEDLKAELQRLPTVGQVAVTRSQSLVGYEWTVEFESCSDTICNEGDLLLLEATDIDLQGCGGPALDVAELIPGSGAESYDEVVFDGQYPAHHIIENLVMGNSYFVQVKLRNSQGYGLRRLSTPLHATPQINPPGPPPPVVLVDSTSTSITVRWRKPTVNGGGEVSGYELYIDEGGNSMLVYDGAGRPDATEFTVRTNNIGQHSQILETGRQYSFKVRAINNCDTVDFSKSCFGEFSRGQAFTVREPRPPFPPPMPTRGASTRVTSPTEASIAVSWSPPVDNGGSPITGYILYMRDKDGTTTNHPVSDETTFLEVDSLNPGELYNFHLVAVNALGKSGNSPVLSILAAHHPGLSLSGYPEFSNLEYRPTIKDVQQDRVSVKWSPLPSEITGGSHVTGFKLYMYEANYPLARVDADPINQEVQHLVISSKESVSGTFTVSFLGSETPDIPVDATPIDIKIALENLPSINIVRVHEITDGWAVTFLSEAGDLPLMEPTSGRLSGNAKIVARESIKGDAASIVYDGSQNPGRRHVEVVDLTPNTGYAFKVAPVNAVGEGLLSAASIVTVARAGASSTETTASGGALTKGIAGSIQEEQIVTFLSGSCATDMLIVSFQATTNASGNLCNATSDEFEFALRSLGTGDVHVTRQAAVASSGLAGYEWKVTFQSFTGDVPSLTVDKSRVGNGRGAKGGSEYVTEFLKGHANEFTIEPKSHSGKPVTSASTFVEAGPPEWEWLYVGEAQVDHLSNVLTMLG